MSDEAEITYSYIETEAGFVVNGIRGDEHHHLAVPHSQAVGDWKMLAEAKIRRSFRSRDSDEAKGGYYKRIFFHKECGKHVLVHRNNPNVGIVAGYFCDRCNAVTEPSEWVPTTNEEFVPPTKESP